MEASMLLCDFAEEMNGKLYVMGGGWTQIVADAPIPVALAILITVPWQATNESHSLRVELLTEDGEAVTPEGAPGPLLIEGKLEVGRPPGIKHGSDQNAPIALRFVALSVPAGGYRFDCSVDGTLLTSRTFTAFSPQG